MKKLGANHAIQAGVAIALSSGMWISAQSAGLDQQVNFHIPPEPMPPALMQFSDQADMQVVTQAGDISQSRTKGISGLMPVSKGLNKLLKGTRFSYALIGGKTVAIKVPAARRASRDLSLVAQASTSRPNKADVSAPPQNQQENDPKQGPARLGKVTVTGTRIKRTDVETAQPITRISRRQIQRSGYTNLGELLGQFSFAGGHATTRYNGTRTTINLRYLGANRNLVLVDGKRWIPGLDGTTNLDTIPTSVIDHIEILQDGASAVYGSDAIAGVVNVITVKNFNGAETHAYFGIHNGNGLWDGQVRQYDFTVGAGNDRGNVVFNATYRKQNPYRKGARELTRHPIAGKPDGIGGASGGPRGRVRLFGPAVSNRTFGQGACDTYNPDSTTNTLCDLTLQNVPAQPSIQNFRNWRPTDAYNFAAPGYLQSPLKDVSLYVQGHYDLLDNVTFSANATYIRDEAAEKFPSDPIKLGANAPTSANGKKIGVAATNPYNPFGVDLVANSTSPCLATESCIGLSRMTRFLIEGGPRGFNVSRDNFHIFAGFNGYVNLFNREIDWNVGFAQNRVQSTRIGFTHSNLVRVARALGPASQCTSPCVPLNLFGGSVEGDGGTITQDQLDYIHYEPHTVSQSNLRDWTANLSSDLYDLPAGPLGLAIGYERLDNYGYHHPDSVQVQGNDADTNSNGRALGGRVVRNAEYAELNIPLLADLPGVKELSVDIANRWTQFKRSGGVEGQQARESFVHNSSGRLNIRYQVFSDLLLRASWSQGFRSPNVSELFGGQNERLAQISDPCAGGAFGGYQGGPLPPNCPNGTENAQPGFRVPVVTGSNANLQPESSLSRTVGAVYSPSQVPGLDVNADYFKIELNNAVGTVGNQSIVNGCFNNFSYCNLVQTSGNQITNIFNIKTNVGSLLTEGVDFGIHYKFPSTPIGDFDARITGTFLNAYDQTKVNRATTTGFATSHLAGTGNKPKRRFNGYLNWDYGNWGARYHIEYFGDAVDQCGVNFKGYCTYPNRTTDFQGTPGQFPLGRQHLGATVYHDVNVTYSVPSIDATFAVGVNNIFAKKPDINGQGRFYFNLYRLPSRVVYGNIRVRF